jgi:hypothetical protein
LYAYFFETDKLVRKFKQCQFLGLYELVHKGHIINNSLEEKSRNKLEDSCTVKAHTKENMALKGAALQNYNTELVHRKMFHLFSNILYEDNYTVDHKIKFHVSNKYLTL